MSMIQGTIGAARPEVPRRWRAVAVAAALMATLAVGFQAGRAMAPTPRVVRPVTPMLVLDTSYPGPGHVPRHWVNGP